jgi:hypothetical protein
MFSQMKQMWAPIKCVPTLYTSLRIGLREKLSRISHEVEKQEATVEKKRQWGGTREQVERRKEEEREDTDWKMRTLLAYFPYFEKKKNRSRLMRSPCSLCICVSS